MAFAATENAKVCTSVRIRYLTVEKIRFGDRRRARGAGCGGLLSVAGGTVEMGGVAIGKGKSYQRDAEKQALGRNGSFDARLPSYFLIYVKVIEYDLRSYIADVSNFPCETFQYCLLSVAQHRGLVRW